MQTKKSRVLMFDYDKYMIDMWEVKFKEGGFEFMGLPDAGGDVIEIVNQFKPDIISLNTLVLGRTGLQILELLKSNPSTKDIPIMILGNKIEDNDAEKAKALGTVGAINSGKITPSEVIEIFTKYLAHPSSEFICLT